MYQYFSSSSLHKKSIIGFFFILSFIISFGVFSSQFPTINTGSISDSISVPVKTPDGGDGPNQGQFQSPLQIPTKSGNNILSNRLGTPNMKTSAIPSTLGYNTTTIFKNNTNFKEATGDLVPFAEKYRINSTFNGWTSEYNTTGFPFQFHNDTLTNGSSMWSNNTIGFPMNPIRFIPGFTVNITLAVNDTITTGDVDLYVYTGNNTVVASSTNDNATEFVQFTPSSAVAHIIEIRHRANSAFTSSNFTLYVSQEVNKTKYGMTPGYIPINKFVYNRTGIPKDTSVYTNQLTDFPHILRFIKGFPVNITLDVMNYTTDGDVDLFVFNATGSLVGSSTNTELQEQVIFVPDNENFFYIQIYHSLKTPSRLFSNISLTIQQYATPDFAKLYMGDAGTTEESFNWIFSKVITSFGVNPSLATDINKIEYNRTDTGLLDYFNNSFFGFNVDDVYDNDTWATDIDSFYSLLSENSLNGALAGDDRYQSFVPIFIYSGDLFNLDVGYWYSSISENSVFGANPQVLRFMSYFGLSNSPLDVDQVSVYNSAGKLVLDLSSSFSQTSLSTFGRDITVFLPATNLLSGSYTMQFNNGSNLLYSYPFIIDDSLYGNFLPADVSVGYKSQKLGSVNSKQDITVIYAQTSDRDTTVEHVEFSYTSDGVTWSTPHTMEWLDENRWGFVVPLLVDNIVNWSISLFESAPSDIGNVRLQLKTEFLPDLIDLTINTSTTMKTTFIPHGGNTGASTTVAFTNDGTFLLDGLNGVTLIKNSTTFVYTINSSVAEGTPTVAEFKITPKNPGLLEVNSLVKTLSYTDNNRLFLSVIGLNLPTVTLNFVPETLPSLYPYLNTTYSVGVSYMFTGGTPSSDFSIILSGSTGSLITKTLQINTSDVYPLVVYQITLTTNVSETYKNPITTINIMINYDSITDSVSQSINVYTLKMKADFYDLNGFVINTIYTKLITKLHAFLRVEFFNGTPKNSLSVTLSALNGFISDLQLDANISQITGNYIDIPINVEPYSQFSKNSEKFFVDITWDGNFDSLSIVKSINPFNNFEKFFTFTSLNLNPININSSSYDIRVNLSSTFPETLRDVSFSLKSLINEKGLEITNNPNLVHSISKNSEISLEFKLLFNSSFKPDGSQMFFELKMDNKGLNSYVFSFTIPYKQTNLSDLSSTTSISNSTPTTPGFELIVAIGALVLVQKNVKQKKKKK